MAQGFGGKARIGQLYPSGGISDYEPQVMAPDGVQFVTTRLTFRQTGLADDRALADRLEDGAGLLADADVDLILFNCTAASLVIGPDTINRRIKAATGIDSTTTIEGVLAALAATGLRRIALMTAYLPEVVHHEIEYFGGRGLTVVADASHARTSPIAQGEIPAEQWYDLAMTMRDSAADGLLISCAGIQISPVIAAIERDWGRPVVASNQAALWQCLRMLDLPDAVEGYGALLRREFG